MKSSLWSFSILDRYLVRGLYKAFFAVTVILVLIIFANNLVLSLEKIVGGYFNSEDLWSLMGFELLEMLGFLIPPSFFFAVLVSLGRLYRDSEIIAMQASGIGPVSLYKACLVGAVPVILLTSFLVMVSLPWAKYSVIQLEANRDLDKSTIGVIETGKFQELQKGETVFFAESLGKEEGEIKNIFIQNRRNGKPGIISAQEGYQYIDKETGDHYLVLKNGFRYTGEPGENTYTSSQFYEYGIRIRRIEQKKADMPVKAQPTAQLWDSDIKEHQIEMQFRLSIPLALLALAFLAVPLSRSLPRQGIYGRLLLAFIVYFSFMNVHKLAKRWLEDGDSPMWLGMWWLPVTAILLALLIELRDRYDYLLNWKTLLSKVRR